MSNPHRVYKTQRVVDIKIYHLPKTSYFVPKPTCDIYQFYQIYAPYEVQATELYQVHEFQSTEVYLSSRNPLPTEVH